MTVLAPFPNRPGGRLYRGYRRTLFCRDVQNKNFVLVRCFSFLSRESHLSSRLLENLSFGATAGMKALTISRPDVIYANTWPIVATGILFLVTKLRGIPFVVNVQDLYPEAVIVQQRMGKDSFLVRLMRWVDGVIVRHSCHTVVISERFAEIYRDQRRVKPGRLSLVPNWIDSTHIDIGIARSKFRIRMGIAENDFLIVYGGNIGVAAGVETAVESMRHLAEQDNARLLVAGAGSQLPACQELARHIPGERIIFHSPWLSEETSEVLCSADVLLLPTRGEQSMASMPSKLISYMLAARPVLAQALPGSDLADIVAQSGCGWVIIPDNPSLLAAQIGEVMALDRSELARRGEAGRAFALKHFTRETCVPRIVGIVESAAADE